MKFLLYKYNTSKNYEEKIKHHNLERNKYYFNGQFKKLKQKQESIFSCLNLIALEVLHLILYLRKKIIKIICAFFNLSIAFTNA